MNARLFYTQRSFWIVMAIVVFLINQLPLLSDMRPVMCDEAWYANTAYHFSQGDGFLNSAVGSGGNANFLLPMLTGTMFWIFGYSLFTIRLTAVLCGVFTLVFLHQCLKELKSSVVAEVAVLGFFISSTLYNTIFRFGRPECASIMCMMGGILYLLRYMREHSWGNMIGLSIFTFFAAIGHPYTLLFFAIAGCVLLILAIRWHKWENWAHLFVLILTAIFSLIAMNVVAQHYDIAKGPSMYERFSMGNIIQALPAYLKQYLWSKTTLYMVVLLPVIIWGCWQKESRVREIAFCIVVFMILFPFLFSTDMMMLGLGADYVAIVGTLLIAPCVDYLLKFRFKVMVGIIFTIYCMLNLGLNYYYNYGVKYEKCNTILEHDLKAIIPRDAVVFTSIRQYPMVLQNRCYTDHYRAKVPNTFDFLILNKQDLDRYDNSVDVYKTIKSYNLIYSKETKSYGEVLVYKHN
ncbi:MAG: glycosyltransferase family 39 protein [Paludibacteraceae bacterium]|nr:glycosyltransferase family 39 protein [Paludibacteraceae bacterium]